MALLIKIVDQRNKVAADKNQIGTLAPSVHLVGKQFFAGKLMNANVQLMLPADALQNIAVETAVQHIKNYLFGARRLFAVHRG
jgi:hypothetical protein